MNTPEILDCGHAPDAGAPANVDGKTIMGWQFVLTADGRKICHACADNVTLDCGHKPSAHAVFTTGYGKDKNGKTFCYDCCAEDDRANMRKNGIVTLYLSKGADGKYTVGNWPGTLRIPVYGLSIGKHNMARVRYDFGFTFEGQIWSGTQYGDNTQIAHCRRIKK